MTAEVHGLLKTRDEAFRSGDKAALKTARANLSRGIKNAKRSYAQKINNHFTDSRDTRSLWQAIQTITDYKPPPQACDDDLSLPAGALLRILGPLDSIFTRALLQTGRGGGSCWFSPPYRSCSCRIPLGRNRDCVLGRALYTGLKFRLILNFN